MDPHLQPDATPSSEQLAVDVAPFAAAVGSPSGLADLAALADFVGASRPAGLVSLRSLLARYRHQLLAGIELPAIRDAFEHARRGEARELIALDRRLAGSFGRSSIASASRHTGRQQLRRLRPLRDQALQRYLRAVDEGEATGWHVVVFGILLALFSLPLRQGLSHYALKSQQALLDSASIGLALPAPERESLEDECAGPLPELLQQIVPGFEPQPV